MGNSHKTFNVLDITWPNRKKNATAEILHF